MKYDTSELCDIYQEDVNVVEPLFSNFGGRSSFGGQIITVKCFEDNGLLYDLLEQNGRGHILLIDGGGSVRRALIDADLARLAVQNEWEGLVVYGAVRQVDDLEELDIGIQAIAAIPVGSAGEGIGGVARPAAGHVRAQLAVVAFARAAQQHRRGEQRDDDCHQQEQPAAESRDREQADASREEQEPVEGVQDDGHASQPRRLPWEACSEYFWRFS